MHRLGERPEGGDQRLGQRLDVALRDRAEQEQLEQFVFRQGGYTALARAFTPRAPRPPSPGPRGPRAGRRSPRPRRRIGCQQRGRARAQGRSAVRADAGDFAPLPFFSPKRGDFGRGCAV